MAEHLLSTTFEEKIWPVYCTRKGATKKTKENVHLFLEKLCTFSKKDPLLIEATDANHFHNHLITLIQKGKCKASYVKVILISLRKFYDFLLDYQYDFRDRGIEVPGKNPFADLIIDIPDKLLLTAEDLPSLSSLDKLLEESEKTNPSLFLAISFASKMGLTISEISNLTKSSLGYMQEEYSFEPLEGSLQKHLYVCLNSVNEFGKTKRYLRVPADVEKILQETILPKDQDIPYVVSYKGKHYSDRTMQYQLKKLCSNLKIRQVTFQDLRNLAIYLMKEGGAKEKEIANYTGQEGRWLTRFQGVSASMIFDAVKYNRITIHQEETNE